MEGSPINKILISPLNFPWPNFVKSLLTPPNNCNKRPLFTDSFSQIEGAKEFINISYILVHFLLYYVHHFLLLYTFSPFLPDSSSFYYF